MSTEHLTYSNGVAFRLMPYGSGLNRFLGPLETEVMQLIWQDGRSTVKKVHRKLSQQRGIAYITVMTTMSRLAEKGVLNRHREGLAYVYTPALTEADFAALAVREVVGRLLDDYADLVLSQVRAAGYTVEPAM